MLGLFDRVKNRNLLLVGSLAGNYLELAILKLLDLLHPPGMAPLFKWGLQPEFHHPLDQFLAKQVGADAQDIGIVVPAAHFGGDAVMAGGGANARNLIRRDAHSYAGATHQNTTVRQLVTDSGGDLKGVIRVIHTFFPGGTNIVNFMSHGRQEVGDALLDLITPVVTA